MPGESQETPDIYSMSDEELEKYMLAQAESAAASQEQTQTAAADAATSVADSASTEGKASTSTAAETSDTVATESGASTVAADANAENAVATAEVGTQSTEAQGADPATATGATATEEVIDWKARYEEIMAPIKAGGQEITLRDGSEVRALIQRGVGYTKRMQEMAPQRKMVMMLQQAGLTDLTQLSHLIEVSRGDAGAIQRLLKDRNIDPLSLDPEQSTAYAPRVAAPSDDEIRFNEELDEAQATPLGVELLSEAAKWDSQSQQALGETPGSLAVLIGHKERGIYAKVTSEISRRQALGQLPPQPFIASYKAVAEEMFQAGAFNPVQNQNTNTAAAAKAAAATQSPDQGNAGASTQVQVQQPLAVRAAQASASAASTRAAAAASPSRGSVATSGKPVELADLQKMSDADFEKYMLAQK